MFNSLKQWREERGLENTVGDIVSNLLEELTELSRAYNQDEAIDALCDIIVFSVNAIEAKGYDAEKCMQETLKEIHSRKGAFNPNSGKWEKFKDEESKKQWYKANYKVCKR